MLFVVRDFGVSDHVLDSDPFYVSAGVAFGFLALSFRVLQEKHTNEEIQQEETADEDENDVEVDKIGGGFVVGSSVLLSRVY